MILGFVYVTNAINYLRLESLVWITSLNGKQVLKPHPFGKPALTQKVTSKISAFIIKSYLEKDLRSVTTNVALYLTHTKKGKVSHSPYLQKQAMGLLFKDKRIREISRPPPTSLLCGCHKWMTPKQFLTLKGYHMKQQPHSCIQHSI